MFLNFFGEKKKYYISLFSPTNTVKIESEKDTVKNVLNCK